MLTNKFKSIFFIIILFLSIFFIFDYSYSRFTQSNGFFSTLSVLSNFQSRQICSCLFVEERTLAQCKSWVTEHFPLLPIQVDNLKKSVSSTFGDRNYYYTNSRFGCRSNER